MHVLKITALVASLCLPAYLNAAENAPVEQDAMQLLAMTNRLIIAQKEFDTAALDRLFAPDYIEISPAGDVDVRQEVLEFYSPSARRAFNSSGVPPPAIELSDPRINITGQTARVIGKETMIMAGVPRSLRVSLHFHKLADGWRIYSAQYTPIREQPPKPAP